MKQFSLNIRWLIMSLLLCVGAGNAWGQTTTLWSEDFSSFNADDVPSGGTYSYVCTNGTGKSSGSTKIMNENIAGGTSSPELMVGKTGSGNNAAGGKFTAVIPLNNIEGKLTLKYYQNKQSLKVSSTTSGVSGGQTLKPSEVGLQTTTFTGITTSMTSITIVFEATTNNNVRLDNIELTYEATSTPTCEAPQFQPSAGTYTSAQDVTLSSNTEGATIYYTMGTNPTDPTTSSTQYTGAISVSSNTTIKAIAVKGGYNNSEVATATYTIKNDVAGLPFEWNGGSSESLLAEDGVSAVGLGSDYATNNAPYRAKFDDTGDYILIHTDSQPGTVTIDFKKIGGAGESTITIQQSSDGTNFTSVEELSVTGAQNATGTLETSIAFATTSRYVKLLFTKSANVGIGGITISKPANITSIVASDVELTAEATSGEIDYTINNPVTGTSLTASTTTSWISNLTVSSDKVRFNTTANNTGEVRTGIIKLMYGSITKDVTITQKKVVSYTEYTLASAIVSGKTYIFASGKDGAVKAMGEQTNNNRSAVSVTSENSKIQASDDAGVCEFVITAKGDNYTIFDGSGYLYAASSSANHLKTETTLDEDGNGLWSIAYNSESGYFEITAQGNYTRKVMQFNSGSSLFACYESASQYPVYLFEKGTGTPMLSFAQTEVTTDYITNGSFTQAAICSNMGDPAPAIIYTIESLDADVDVADTAVLDGTTPGKVNFIAKGDVKSGV